MYKLLNRCIQVEYKVCIPKSIILIHLIKSVHFISFVTYFSEITVLSPCNFFFYIYIIKLVTPIVFYVPKDIFRQFRFVLHVFYIPT